MRIEKISLIVLTILFFSVQLSAQIITADPEFPIAEDSVTIRFDATEGNQELMNYDGDVYAHTGITIDGTQWQKVIADWDENISKARLTRLSDTTYELNITPSIIDYYGASSDDDITELCFVFRSSDGSKQTADLFYDVYESGVQVAINAPSKEPFVVKKGESFNFKASASEADSMELYANEQLLQTFNAKDIDTSLSFGTEGNKWLWVKAYSGQDSKSDSLQGYIRGDVTIAELPQGVQKGINYIDDTTVTLVLQAPGKEFAFAMGDFSNWKLDSSYYMKYTPDSTHFWVNMDDINPGQEYRFQYLIDGELKIADPYTEKILDPWNDKYIPSETYPDLISYPEDKTEGVVSVFQTSQTKYQWEVNDFQAPPGEDLVIYELMVRDFTEDGEVGNIKGVMNKLGYLDSLGVNAIELMPVNEFEGNNSWGYNPSFYFAFDKAYGKKQDMKAFVDSCHKRGIAVIIDMVLNHSYGQSPFVQLYFDSNAGDYGQPTSKNPWYNETCPHSPYCWGFDFDHQSQATRNLVDSINTFWLEEYNIDGFRFDFTKGFTNNTSNDDGWSYDQQRVNNLKRMADEIWKTDSSAYVILEHFTENSEEKELANYGMMLWGNLNHAYNQATMGKNSGTNSDFSWVSHNNRGWDKPHLVGYMESHDEQRLMYNNLKDGNSSGAYNIKDLSVALDRMELAANFFIPVPGPKMIWQFGELGYDYSIDYNGRLGMKPVEWSYYEQDKRKDLYNVFSALNRLKQQEKAFSSDNFFFRNADGVVKELIIEHSDMDIYIIGNFGVNDQTMTPDFPKSGKWYELYTSDSINTSDVSDFELSAGEYRLYTTRKLEISGVGDSGPSSTTIQSFAGDGEVRVYPNPARDVVHFKFDASGHSEILLNIYNMKGQKVGSITKTSFSSDKNKIQWSKSMNGGSKPQLYFYELFVGDKRHTGKFLKY